MLEYINVSKEKLTDNKNVLLVLVKSDTFCKLEV